MGRVADTAAVCRWFAAVGSIITETIGTLLPANGSITAVTFFALGIAKRATLIWKIGGPAITRSYWFSDTPTVGLFPACFNHLNRKQSGQG